MPVFKKSKKPKEIEKVPDLLDSGATQTKVLDKRVGMDCYRDFFTVKNYWKTINRNAAKAGGILLYRYLKENPEMQLRYPKLKNLTIESAECSEKAFETTAAEYLQIFDEVINCVEESPADCSAACQRLNNVGKSHRAKITGMKFDDFQALEAPFLFMIQEILQDRFTDKAENLFRKFFQFCLKYMLEGFNS